MSSTDVGTASSTKTAELSTIDMGLEVVTVPVSDVERAKRFYQSLGWRVDADFAAGEIESRHGAVRATATCRIPASRRLASPGRRG